VKEHFKDPGARLDYGFDWAAWLVGDKLVSSYWKVPPGLAVEDEIMTGTQTIIWLSGGRLGKDYIITNHVATEAGREDDRSMKIKVRHK